MSSYVPLSHVVHLFILCSTRHLPMTHKYPNKTLPLGHEVHLLLLTHVAQPLVHVLQLSLLESRYYPSLHPSHILV